MRGRGEKGYVGLLFQEWSGRLQDIGYGEIRVQQLFRNLLRHVSLSKSLFLPKEVFPWRIRKAHI